MISDRDGSRGFTLVELLLYLTLGGIVIGALVSVATFHQRDMGRQTDLTASRAKLRDSMGLLTSELRAIAPARGDLLAIHRDSVTLRSVQGSGVVCGMPPGGSIRYDILLDAGEFPAQAEDSVLIFAAGGPGAFGDRWKTLKVAGVTAGNYPCAFTVTKHAEYRLQVTGDSARIRVGSPVRTVRRITYALFSDGGSWWLGRRVGTRPFERLTGPFLAPADSGLAFSYLDAAGSPTTNPAAVASIHVLARAQRIIRPQGTVRIDSLRARVAVRG